MPWGNCPAWGPRDSHLYRDEDTNEYQPYCLCGHKDPEAYRHSDESDDEDRHDHQSDDLWQPSRDHTPLPPCPGPTVQFTTWGKQSVE